MMTIYYKIVLNKIYVLLVSFTNSTSIVWLATSKQVVFQVNN